MPGKLAFRMIGNIYYVGTERVSSHLLTSEAGHILLDACYPGDGPAILDNIRAVGFKPEDVRVIAITHAHIDHQGSVDHLKGATGAQVCIGTADVEGAEKGSKTIMGLKDFKPFKVDRALTEGDEIRVGDIAVRVLHTPGHTPGCLTFEFDIDEGGKVYKGILFGGPGLNVFDHEKLKGAGIYGGTLGDYLKTVKRLHAMDPDVFLGAHPGQCDTFGKRDRLREGETPNPYIDPKGWKDFIGDKVAKAGKLSASSQQ